MGKKIKRKLEEPHVFVNFEKILIDKFDSNISVLNFLRNHRDLVGTKEGCSEGDCGACSVLIYDKELKYSPINSCILKVGQIIGKNIITVEGISQLKNSESLLSSLYDQGASQCGFCTPGFVIAATALKIEQPKVNEKQVHDGLSGNLCRCTGYRPIIDAILETKEKIIIPNPKKKQNVFGSKLNFGKTTFFYPRSANDIRKLLASGKDFTPLAGGTDWNLESADQDFDKHDILFLSEIDEMKDIKKKKDSIEFGASVTLKRFENFCLKYLPTVSETINRFGSPQIRSAATIGGNIATSSPIGDLAPIFLVMGAKLHILGKKGLRKILLKDFYIGYRKNKLKSKEIIFKIELPKLGKKQKVFSWKLSKRYDQDISTISLAAKIEFEKGEKIKDVILAAGGVAATPTIMKKTSLAIRNRKINSLNNDLLLDLSKDIKPISDLRGTAEYRKNAMLGLIKKMQTSLLENEAPKSIMSF